MSAKGYPIEIWLLAVAILQAVTSGAQPVTKIAGGEYHSLFLKSDGSLWVMGKNQFGQLGDGTLSNGNQPKQIVASNVTTIAAGDYHSLFLKSDGSLWAMGANKFLAPLGANYCGQLGDGTYNNTNRPEQIVASSVTAIAAGGGIPNPYPIGTAESSHSLFLKCDGSLWVMGDNQFGELGDGTYSNTNRPEQIVASNVTAIAAGALYSLFLKGDGSLWGMGDGPFSLTNRPEQIVASNVTAIAAGDYHSLFIKNDGSLWAMGDNPAGQLGDGTYSNTNRPELIVASNVTAIAAGEGHSLFLKSDGSLWAMGDNFYGQLGDGTYNTTNLPEQIVAGVTAIAAGGWHTLFLKSDGSLWGMGLNQYGELGDGTYKSTNRPERILAAYNQISGQLLATGDMQLSFVGIAGMDYALDRSFSLSPANWVPQLTNPADADGVLVLTNAPNPTTNNFWRIRSVP